MKLFTLLLSSLFIASFPVYAKTNIQTSKSIYLSHYFLADIAQNLLPTQYKNQVKAIPIDPHESEALSPKLINTISQSQLLVLLAPKSTAWENVLLKAIETNKKQSLYLFNKPVNLHIWLSPKATQRITKKLARILKKVFPKQVKVITNNENKLLANFSALELSFTTQLQNCNKKSILFAHSNFTQLKTDYHLPILSLSQLNQSNAGHHHNNLALSAKQLAHIVELIKTKKIQALFQSRMEPEKIIATLHAETNVPVLRFDTIELKEKKQSYITRMKRNLASLVQGLQCKVNHS